MKKFFLSFLSLGLALSLTACGDDDDNNTGGTTNNGDSNDDSTTVVDANNIDYADASASSWGNYMQIVANLLVEDSETLLADWSDSYNGGQSYATFFKTQDAHTSIGQLIDGCADIANEVGIAKIGDPIDLYNQGLYERALYAVESWYSWHSIDDYSNNILSIRNAYYGSRDGSCSDKSLSAAVKASNSDLDAQVIAAINAAYSAIQAIPAPFRNNINCTEAVAAQNACVALEETLGTLKSYTEDLSSDVLTEVVENYVDVVVLPTYTDLVKYNKELQSAVTAFRTSPSNSNFSACATAWLTAREPWETSEAFLFGPVADKGLDPNMDSWPLDQAAIVNILTSNTYDNLTWSGDYDEEDESIEAVQSVRGFHTLEFLIFKDGQARTVE